MAGFSTGFETPGDWDTSNGAQIVMSATRGAPRSGSYGLFCENATDTNQYATYAPSGNDGALYAEADFYYQPQNDRYFNVGMVAREQTPGGQAIACALDISAGSGSFLILEGDVNGWTVLDSVFVSKSLPASGQYYLVTAKLLPADTADVYAELTIDGDTYQTSGVNPSVTSSGQIGIGQIRVTNTGSDNWFDDESVTYRYATPDAPTSLTASQGAEDEIALSWNDVSNEDGYYLYRAQTSGATAGDYTQIADLPPNTTSYTDTGLEDGERYYYRVSAYTGSSEGDLSNEDAAITVLPTTTPSLDSSTEDEIALSWSKQDDSADGEWEIFRSQDGTLGAQIADAISPSTASYTDTGLEDGEEYHYTLRRVTDHAQADAQAAATTLLPPPTISGIDSSIEDELTISYSLADDSSDGDVELLRSTDGTTGTVVATITDLTSTSYTDTGLSDGEQYHYTLRRNTNHASADSTQVPETTILPAPTNLASPSHSSTSIDLVWTNNHDYGDTKVQYRRSGVASWTTFSTLSRTTEAETITSLLNGEAYDIRIVAQTEHTSAVDQ